MLILMLKHVVNEVVTVLSGLILKQFMNLQLPELNYLILT
jgi:hypothetical protein